MQLFHKNNGKKSLLIFFSGWALDFNPLAHLFSDEILADKDLLFVWDYRNNDFEFDFSKYEKIDVVSFSYGVFMSQFVELPQINSNVAICGTLCPISREFGINPKMFDLTLKTLNEITLQKFYQNMFSDENEYEKFLSVNSSSKINIENLKEELENIKKMSLKGQKDVVFTKSIIAHNDRIIPTNAQVNYWKDKISAKIIDSGHFPFFEYSLRSLLND